MKFIPSEIPSTVEFIRYFFENLLNSRDTVKVGIISFENGIK